MISKKKVLSVVTEAIKETNIFIVSLDVKNGNKIIVKVDHPEGLPVKECVRISRAIEDTFDRDVEDYEMQVTSPGLDQPLVVYNQYLKVVGKSIKVQIKNGEVYTGVLTNCSENELTLSYDVKIKVEGKKKKNIENRVININFEDIDKAYQVIEF